MSHGKVWLVGAGPGDPGLLTVKGLRALERADVIVADRLGARAVLDGLAAEGVALTTDIVDVGKRPGHHAVPQDAINALLVQLAQDGKTVVRLKGGDPYVFGRGGEELEACQRAGVDAEIVPGITSAISVPALAGIPLTHRGLATAFTVVTGHDQIATLSGGRDHTVVLLMGVGTLANSALILARGERGADCPVAVVEDGYGPRERVTFGTLATIAALAAERGIRSPAVVVIGDVVRVSPQTPAELAISGPRRLPRTFRASRRGALPKGIPAVTDLNLRVAIVGAGPAGIYAGNILANTVREAGGRRRDRPVRVAPRTVRPHPLRRRARPPAHQGHRQLAPRDARRAERRGRRPLDPLHRQRRGGPRHLAGRSARALRRRDPRHRRDPRRRARASPASICPARSAPPTSSPGSTATPTSRATGRSTAREVAVIGNGNVALDVARVLAKHAVDLRPTEIADNVLAGLEASAVTDVHVFGRRGPADIKFTPIELRELGEVPDVDIVVHDEDFGRRPGAHRPPTIS